MPDKRQGKSSARVGSHAPLLNTIRPSAGGAKHPSGVGAATGLRKLSGSERTLATPIAFGKPSQPETSRQSVGSGVNWESLLKKGTHGGLSKMFGGGLLGFGIDKLFSGLAGLFGGSSKPALEPLKEFALPDSQNAVLYASSNRLSTVADESANVQRQTTGIYTSRTVQVDQASVVKAVKNALLTSSSLNDIIGDL